MPTRAAQAVIDADVLFKLARVQVLDRLLRVIHVVYVPDAVRREAKLYGRQRRRPDVARFRRRCRRCREKLPFVLHAILGALRREDPRHDHDGEAEAIAQAEALGVPTLLTDDRAATRLARERGIEVIASPTLLRYIAALGE